jgi:outer membrane receptor for monomeric catechols
MPSAGVPGWSTTAAQRSITCPTASRAAVGGGGQHQQPDLRRGQHRGLQAGGIETYELGTKWELLDERLNLTAALFRTELEDSWEYSEGETSPVRALPAKRVDGLS